MTLEQVKAYVIGVLKGWFTNKKILDGFSESEAGKLMYKNAEVGGGSDSVTDAEVTAAITATLTELNADSTATETE